MTLTAATLFSGVGAPEVAMPHWRWAWCAEIEKFPSAVMAARHPHSVNLGDVSADDFTERAAAIARPDILVFGSPCQSFSVAGKRLGLDDPRGNLALVALGIVDRLKPRWFCFENVPGLMSSDAGRDFGAFIGLVDELGYSLAWCRLDAQYFGVAQRRERVFAVGYLGDWRYPAAVLFEPESLCGDHPPRRQAGEGTASAIGFGIGDSGVGKSLKGNSGGIDREDGHTLVEGVPDIAWALQERDSKGADSSTKEGHLIVADPVCANEQRTYTHEGKNNFRMRNVVPVLEAGARTGRVGHEARDGMGVGAAGSKDHGADASESVAPTLRAGTHDKSHANAGVPPAIAFQTRIARNGRGRPEEIVPALNGADAGTTSDMRPVLATASAVRRLTPVECERLQGFEDNHTLIKYRGKPAADGPRYKALGNSMAVPVIGWILNRIELVDGIRHRHLHELER